MPFPKAIITKPFLVSDTEYKDLGLNINLVGYDSFSQVVDNTTQHISPRLLNWVEPYEVSGVRKTLFYTEVNTNFQVGDRVYILNGNYDNDSLIKKDKYKKGRDGYKILKVDQCKLVLDIDYTGALPYNDDSFDDYIKVYYIDDVESFVSANRQVTTRGGNFDYKFNYYQNNIAFIDKDLKGIEGWGLNGGVTKTPGFFVREGREGWSKITDEFVYLGSFSVALSPTYKNNGRMVIMDGSFVYNGIQFKEGFVYSWNVGPTSSSWQVDPGYSPAIITKSSFRNGTFNGKFNNGLYGTQQNKLNWTGKGNWNGGSMVNTLWKSGTIDSKISITNTYRANFDEYGIPFQKSYTNNNNGFGFNFIFDSEIDTSLVNNGNFYNTTFKSTAATFSVVEDHIMSVTHSFDNRIVKAYFDLCKFSHIQINGGELKNTRIFNSKLTNVKSINSYFEQSVLKDSTYVSDKIIKILGYDEWNMSEYMSLYSGQFSTIRDVNSKIYKFYISKESFRRMKTEDAFYIKGLKVKNSPNTLEFFDSKFRLTSWTEFYEDLNTTSKAISGTDPYSFYKRGYECSAFLSTPEENAYIINSSETLYNELGLTMSKYMTVLSGKNTKAAYSIDIIVSRHDIYNKNQSIDTTSEWDAQNPKNFNYSSDVIVGTTSLPEFLGNNIDISNAYILDSDFESGIIETSDWNSGHHINYNNDVVITSVTHSGQYNLSIDDYNDHLIAQTNLVYNNPEKIGKDVISEGDIVFLNSVDYDTTGMVTKVTLLGTGSSYSTTSDPVFLVNTKVDSLTMSNVGTYYRTETNIPTSSTNGNGSGLTLDLVAREIGAVLAIAYSAPISNGGSYSMNLSSPSVSTTTGPIGSGGAIATSMPPSFGVLTILTDDAVGTITGIPASQNGNQNATYSTFGPPLTAQASGAVNVGAIFLTGPLTVSANGVTSSPSSLGAGLTLNYNTSANGSITYLEINNSGSGYGVGQVFKIEGGNATFSITSISKGEITSFSINNPGEDYLSGEVLDVIKPFNPNFMFGSGTTASIVVTSITVSNSDTKGLSLDLLTGTGPLQGQISDITINNPGLYYNEGEIFTINDGKGNLDALVRIDSVTGSVVRLNDTYKVLKNERGILTLEDLGAKNIVAGLTAKGIFYTTKAMNRWGYISKTKIDKTKIKSGLFKRPYITNSLIRDIDYDSTDINMTNYDKTKNLLISDALFSANSNILSSATYLYSNLVGGSDIWNDGIIYKSVINGMTFSKGTVRQSTWIDGNFTGGMFYNSKSFDAKPTIDRPNFLNDRVRSYYMTGMVGATLSNNRYSWRNGKFTGGEFYKSDWENGVMDNGLFYYSKFYGGTVNGGKIGTKAVAAEDTRIYNGLINYTTVDNASVYSEDSSYSGLSRSNITWMDGIFNNGVFGSNNNDILGVTVSNISYKSVIESLPIADFKITIATASVIDTNPILGDFEIDAKVTIKHTYLGDLIINLMSPNGKIINMKKRYSCGGNDNLIQTIFTSDSSKPNIEIGTPPYSGEFKFDALANQGVYYDLNNKLLPNIPYIAEENTVPEVLDYKNRPPAVVYEGDRYLVVATASDPSWTPTLASPFSNPWNNLVGQIVEKSNNPALPWEAYKPKKNDKIYVKNRSEYLKYIETPYGTTGFNRFSRFNIYKGWVKSYHSNSTKISEQLNTNKTTTGTWTLMVMDCAALDSGFIEDFELNFNYKTSYIIKSFKNDAVWHDGIFNGGQFIDLGVWKTGTFNGGKFISTYGYEESGNYLFPSTSISEYSWQGGVFNGGEFGNESLLSNSTWFNGEFNGGVFKGKLWNNGIFTYGEFKGGAAVPAIGNGIKSLNAQTFIDSFKNEYYGVWRGGVVSDKKDSFVSDKKLFTEPKRATAPIKTGNVAKFTNMLWASGTFNHPSGEMINSVWMNGLFKMGKFQSSAFNPYVTRNSDQKEFIKDDSCIWENGKLIDSEFHMSKWKYGHFISGTAVGMIWQNGISNYMNAYNIFWENGVWRNGNWYGSNFEYRGKVDDGFDKTIINRGIEWSGTSSCHIWNIFESDVDTTAKTVVTQIETDSFTTTNAEDLGAGKPKIEFSPGSPYTQTTDGSSTFTIVNSTEAKAKFKIIENGGAPITQAGFMYKAGDTLALAQSNPPSISISGGLATGVSGTIVVPINPVDPAIGVPVAVTALLTLANLNTTKYYSIQAYAINEQCNVSTGPVTSAVIYFQTAQPNTVSILQLPTTLQGSGELYIQNNANSFTQVVSKSINLTGTYDTPTNTSPAPISGQIGFFYVEKNITDSPVTPTENDPHIDVAGSSTPFSKTLSVNPNKAYYIRAYTRNTAGYGLSGVTMKVVSGVTSPTVVNPAATATTLSADVTDGGGSTNDLVRGFIIEPRTGTGVPITIFTSGANRPTQTTLTPPTPSSTRHRVIADSNAGVGTFNKAISSITGLTPGGLYRAMAYAYKKIPGSTPDDDYNICFAYAYSAWVDFVGAPTPPSVTTTTTVADITTIGAKLSGKVTSTNGTPVTATGFVYTTTAGVYTSAVDVAAEPLNIPAANTTFDATISTGLAEGQKYYFKAYATNTTGTEYGSEQSFMTLPLVSALVYNFGGSTNNNSTKTTTVGIIPIFTVTSAQTYASKGIIWSATNTTANWWLTALPAAKTTDTATTTTLSTATVGTSTTVSNKKYFVVGYATNTNSNTYYTAPIEVYTKPTFISSTVVTATSSSDGFTITVKEGTSINNAVIDGASGNSVNITARGVMWGTPASWLADPWTNAPALTTQSLAGYSIAIGAGGTTGGVVNPSTTPLVPGTLYYYRPVVTNLGPAGDNAGYYGSLDSISVTTLVNVIAPSTSLGITYTSINATTGKINIGTPGDAILVTNTGGAATIRYGICYIAGASEPTSIPNAPSTTVPTLETIGTAPASFTKEIPVSQIATPTWYKVRAYVENAGGIAYSKTITFSLTTPGVIGNLVIG